MLFVILDAGQGPSGGPSGMALAGAAIDSAMDSNVRMSYDGFALMLQTWRDDIVRYRCGFSSAQQAEIRDGNPDWKCDDVNFMLTHISFTNLGVKRGQALMDIPTRLKLPAPVIDELIAAGRESVRDNAVVQAFQRRIAPSR